MKYPAFLLLFCFQASVYGQDIKTRPYAPELFPDRISSGVCGFTLDGSEMYYVQEDTLKDKLFLYSARNKNGKWVTPQLLPFSGSHNDFGGRLSDDGSTFYFTSDRPGGSARDGDGWNIWRVERIQGTWSEPIPLLELNNKGNECCPVPIGKDRLLFSGDRGKEESLHIKEFKSGSEEIQKHLNAVPGYQWPSSLADDNTLLLNSMRKGGFGKDDIYFSIRVDGEWSTPKNIGAAINSEVYEDSAILSPDKKWLIFNRHTTHETPSQVLCVPWADLKMTL